MKEFVTLVHPKSGGRAEVAAIRVPQLKRQGWRVETKKQKEESVETGNSTGPHVHFEANKKSTEATGAEASKKEKE